MQDWGEPHAICMQDWGEPPACRIGVSLMHATIKFAEF